MIKVKFSFVFLLFFSASAFTLMQSLEWKLKEDSYSVIFKGTKVEGVIKGLKASILFDPASPERSKISASFDVNTVNTGNGMMNKHALSEDALNAKGFPTIAFESITVTGKNGSYTALGKLTIKGVSKDVSLPFTFENKSSESLFKGKLSIVPREFNIAKKGVPEVLEIDITVPVTK